MLSQICVNCFIRHSIQHEQRWCHQSSRGYTDYCLFGLLVEFLFFELGIVISVIFKFKFCLELFVVIVLFIFFLECIVCLGCSCLFCCTEYRPSYQFVFLEQ